MNTPGSWKSGPSVATEVTDITTIAARSGKMACDSRITGSYIQNGVKIVQGDNIIVGWAGDWVAGYAIAEQIAKIATEDEPKLDDSDDVEFLIMIGRKLYLGDKQMRMAPIHSKYYAIGSGGQAAMVAMNLGCSAEEAVKEAIKVDEASGGRVRVFTNG